jgi:hypothetical protein
MIIKYSPHLGRGIHLAARRRRWISPSCGTGQCCPTLQNELEVLPQRPRPPPSLTGNVLNLAGMELTLREMRVICLLHSLPVPSPDMHTFHPDSWARAMFSMPHMLARLGYISSPAASSATLPMQNTYNVNVPTNIFSQGYVDMELECPSASANIDFITNKPLSTFFINLIIVDRIQF